jgi:dTDP-4-dehydrorhamnose 3,5-epimerase-like enzyme
MAYLTLLKTFSDARGNLTVAEREVPFEIKRVFFIYGMASDTVRGGHRHFETIHACISVKGSCRICVEDGEQRVEFLLDSAEKCLILNPEDWHTMQDFSPDCVLLVLASDYYKPDEYIYEGYSK